MKIINPNIPDPYCYETDYRKIPREYLNKRIPKGRNIIKWQPFKTMPQQYEILDQYIENQNKIDMPLLSEEQLESINDIIKKKINTNSFCTINYWDNGYIKQLSGIIKKVDTINEVVCLTTEIQKEVKINFSIIFDVE